MTQIVLRCDLNGGEMNILKPRWLYMMPGWSWDTIWGTWVEVKHTSLNLYGFEMVLRWS